MDGWMNVWIDGWMDGWTNDGWIIGFMDRCIFEWTDGQSNGCIILLVSNPLTLLEEYFKVFSSKTCCYDDIKYYLTLLSKEEQLTVCTPQCICILTYVTIAFTSLRSMVKERSC